MTDQQFCLRWNNHQSTLVAVFDGLLEKGVLVDCTLAAEGQQLTAHKVVLAACSPFLETLLSRHYDKHPILILKDVKFSELKAMMDYMYRGEVNISQDQLGTFLKAAESLQIKGLSDGGGNEKDTHSTKRHHERKPLRPTSPLRNSMPPVPPVVDGKRPPPPFLHNSIRNSLKSSPLLVDIPEDSLTNRGRDGSISPIPRKKKRPREPEELNPLNNNVLCKTELNIDENPVTGARPSPEEPARVPSPDADRIKADSALDKTDPSAHLKHELIEEEEDINEDSVELTLDEDEMGEAGPSHNEGDYSNDFYGGTQDGDNRDGQGVEGTQALHHRLFAQIKGDASGGQRKRGRPRKDGTAAAKPIGRPRKFLPAIGDPIRFLQNVSMSGLLKVNDENAHISGLASFLNPNFQASIETRIPDENGPDTPDAFSCQFCGKTYKKKKHYNRHINFECINTEPRFLCTMCAYRARRKEHLIRHLRSHIGDLINANDNGIVRDDAGGVKDAEGSPIPHSVLGVRQNLAEWPLPYSPASQKDDSPILKDDTSNGLLGSPSTPMFALQQGLDPNLTC